MANDIDIEDIDLSIKIIVVGNGQVGKTTMAIKFVKNIYTSEYKKTLGVDFLSTKRYLKPLDKEVDFTVWDTAGQEQYNAITRRYYRGSDACLIVFSISDRNSFENVQAWYDKVKAECENIVIYLVMSKIDLADSAQVTEEEAAQLAKKLGVKLEKVSSKNGIRVKEVFENLAIDHFKKGKYSSSTDNVDNIIKGDKSIPNKEEKKDNDDDIKEIKSSFAKDTKKKDEKQTPFQLEGKNETNKEEDKKKKKKKKNCC